MTDIWIWVHHQDDEIDELTYGLVAEAKRLAASGGNHHRVTAVALGAVSEATLAALGNYGVDRVLSVDHACLARYEGELFGRLLGDLVQTEAPVCLLMAQTPETEDLAQRVAARLETTLITRAMDFSMHADGTVHAVRPVANGHLFEALDLKPGTAPIVLFLPAVLLEAPPDQEKSAPVSSIAFVDPGDTLATRTVQVIAAAPEALDLEEADIVVSGGRGVGKGDAFDIIHALARAIGGTVGGTRPIIDWGDLPYERQIGQTGKYVAPRLIINCGISGANEYTAGMEKAQIVVAIDRNPRARIFRFADLGVVGDLHEILPLLISRIEDQK